MFRFQDQTGRMIEFDDVPKRIVSLVPSQTELLFVLGLEKHIVGITKFCIFPKNKVSRISQIGGTKSVNFEKIRQLQPHLIIGNKEENTEKGRTQESY